MNENNTLHACINCGRTMGEVPVIPLLHRDGQAFICPQCLPVLIHKPQVLVGKLSGAELLQPHEE